VRTLRIPRSLRDAVEEDDHPARYRWLAALPELVGEVASDWGLDLGDPYEPGGQCAWVAPVRDPAGHELVLKVGWRHPEAEHEADALRFWDGDGAVRCNAARSFEEADALLLERCVPGVQLKCRLAEAEQDVVVAGLLRRLRERQPREPHAFGSLQEMCSQWADEFELDLARDCRSFDPGLAREGIALLRDLPRTAAREMLLCTDLHAGNILAAEREPWLAIDPKPLIGDPAFDVVQHMLNCDQRLARDPGALARRMADLLDLERERVTLWLFARCAQEAIHDSTMRAPARRLAP
jgi:streptomycin 6-kinase